MSTVPDTILPVDQQNPETKTLASKELSSDSTSYSILWWTPPPPPNGQLSSSSFDSSLPFTFDTCGLGYTCTFTAGRSVLSTAGVVLFAGSQLSEQDLPPAAERKPSQAWVLNTVLEDPTDTKMKDPIVTALSPTHALLPLFRADFIETVLQVGSDERPYFLETVFMPPKVDLQEKNRLRGLGKENGGRASAVWITGEDAGWTKDSGIEYVDAPSGREDYVRELVKVMDIDIYGPCMNNTARPVHADNQTPFTAQEIMTDYKFVFALERVNCEDYVTRSLKDALTVGAVPIVDGPQDYSRFAPSANALVQINSFISPEQLAKEIDILDRNDTLYSKRLSYRVGSSSTEGISPLFRQTFGTIKSEAGQQAPAAPASAVTIAAAASWAPDRHGAYCGICQLAHELAQNTYDWTAHTLQQNEKLNNNAACESLPRYLPGLPAQMQAYDAYLQNENNQAHLRQQQEMDRLQQQQQQQQLGDHHQPTFDRSAPSSGAAALIGETGEGNTLPLSEVHYLLLLILALFVGVGALVLILPKSARQKLLWPWRHLFYKKLPHIYD